MKQFILCTVSCLVAISGVFGNGEPMVITRLTTPIILDSIVDEAEWLAIDPLPVIMHAPSYRAPITEETEIRLAYDVREDYLTIHLAPIKALIMLSTKFSISAFLQYNSLDKIYAGNIRLRYNPREGRDLYIVYNDNLNIDLERDYITRPRSNARTFLIKYSHTFSL